MSRRKSNNRSGAKKPVVEAAEKNPVVETPVEPKEARGMTAPIIMVDEVGLMSNEETAEEFAEAAEAPEFVATVGSDVVEVDSDSVEQDTSDVVEVVTPEADIENVSSDEDEEDEDEPVITTEDEEPQVEPDDSMEPVWAPGDGPVITAEEEEEEVVSLSDSNPFKDIVLEYVAEMGPNKAVGKPMMGRQAPRLVSLLDNLLFSEQALENIEHLKEILTFVRAEEHRRTFSENRMMRGIFVAYSNRKTQQVSSLKITLFHRLITEGNKINIHGESLARLIGDQRMVDSLLSVLHRGFNVKSK